MAKSKNKWWQKNIDPDLSEIIIKLNAKLSNKSIDKDWTDDLSLDYENIDNDMENIPSILAFWSAVLAEARREKATIEMYMDIRKSAVLEKTKEIIREGVKLTVNDKENIVNVDPEFLKYRKRYIDIDATVSKLFGIVDALKVKADNLRSFSSMKRAELHNT